MRLQILYLCSAGAELANSAHSAAGSMGFRSVLIHTHGYPHPFKFARDLTEINAAEGGALLEGKHDASDWAAVCAGHAMRAGRHAAGYDRALSVGTRSSGVRRVRV